MRIAYFSDSLPPIADGVSRTLCRLVETLREEHVDFRFFSAMKPDDTLGWSDRVHKVAAMPFLPYPDYKLGLPLPPALDPLLDRFHPELVHVVSPTLLGMFGLDTARRRKIPVVGSFHTDFVSYLPFYGLRGMEEQGWRYLRWFYNRCAVTFAPSASTRDELRRRGFRRVELWQRGISMDDFTPRLRSESLRQRVGATDRPLLLFVGRLVREKNLAELAEAVERVAGWESRFRLAIVGDGPMKDELTARLPAAYFAGFQEGRQLAEWYASADVFVFPSTTETFGNVILEAFASGLPVIAADKGGTRDLVAHGENGLLTQPGDAADLAQQIRALLDRPSYATRLGCGALRTAARYEWSAVNRALLDGYRRVLAEGIRAA